MIIPHKSGFAALITPISKSNTDIYPDGFFITALVSRYILIPATALPVTYSARQFSFHSPFCHEIAVKCDLLAKNQRFEHIILFLIIAHDIPD
jgi:hypothetical protein